MSDTEGRTRGVGIRLAVTLVVAAGLVALACDRPPTRSLPSGRFIVGDAGRVVELLQRLEVMTGTQLARAAALGREKIARCEEFEAWCPGEDSCALLERLSCRGDEPRLDEAYLLLGESDWLFGSELGEGQQLTARGRAAGADVTEVEVELAGLEEHNALSLLLPAERGPGPFLLSADQSLAQIRIRPDGGLDIASMVSREGWASQLFQLKSELFLATALKGNWELAIYVPEEGQRIPPTALALDFTSRTAAVAGMNQFLEEVMQAWPIRMSPISVGDWPGVCLSNLQVMPDLLPCYVATDSALVVGWNPVSLEKALAAGEQPDGGEESRVVLHLDRFPLADERLAAASGADPDATPPAYPWQQIRISGGRQDKGYRLQLAFVAGGDG
ncbi:MAG: hypothetical protein WBH85_04990 [Thermoanaerobaculia bacterium]